MNTQLAAKQPQIIYANAWVMLVAFVFVQLVAALPLHASGTGLIQIPVRWCAVEGSPAVVNPSALGSRTTSNVLETWLQRIDDLIWTPRANILFRSAIQCPNCASIRPDENIILSFRYPVIADPNPNGPGALGDILDDTLNDPRDPSNPMSRGRELREAIASCEAAWERISPNTPVAGPIALNISRFVDLLGNTSSRQAGIGNFNISPPGGVTFDGVCRDPARIIANGSAPGSIYAVVSDIGSRVTNDPDGLLAHEFGHVLFLGHGNGIDDDQNGKYDQLCDPGEDPNALPFSVMTSGVTAHVMTPIQSTTVRAVGRVTAGAKIDPVGALAPGDVISDVRVDAVHDVTADSVDVLSVGMAVNTVAQTTVFSHKLFGVVPSAEKNEYLVFADLDGNPATGSSPSTLGFPTNFQGAELVTRVFVGQVDEFRSIVATVWKFQNGAFAQVTDPQIRADLFTSVDPETGGPLFDVVSVQLPNTVRGPAAPEVRIQAVGRQLAIGGQLDRAPDAPDGGLNFFIAPTEFPVCAVTPAQVAPGTAALVEASDLVRNQNVDAVLGDQLAGTGRVDSGGNTKISFAVPFDSRQGLRPVSVTLSGAALAANCTLEVTGPPATTIAVPIDINPRSCPNPLNVKEQGTIPVAIVGGNSFDVTKVDPSLVKLEGVSPLRSSIDDVAAPFSAVKSGATDCTTAGPDGYPDLVLHFDAQAVVAALGPVMDGQVRRLRLIGNLKPMFGGAPIAGEDVAVILKKP